MAKAGGILGIVALALVMLAPLSLLVAELLSSELVLFVFGGGALFLAFFGCIMGIVLSLCSRMASVWAVIGVVTSALSILGSLVMAGLTLMLM
jgi:hypothetical protein